MPWPGAPLRDAEALEVLEREVEAVAGGVACDVAQDVRELQREAELDGVLARARVLVAEDLDRGEAHRGGDPLAVDAQLGEASRSAAS